MCCFRGLISPKLYVPHQNLFTKGTSLGCWLVSEMIPIARNCGIWAVVLWQTLPSKVPILAVLGPVKSPAQKVGIFVYQCMHAHTDLRLLFQKPSKSVQEKWPKVRTVLVTKTTHVLASLSATPEAISPELFVWVHTVSPWPLTYIPGFIQIRSGLGRYNRNPHDSLIECNTGSSIRIKNSLDHGDVDIT